MKWKEQITDRMILYFGKKYAFFKAHLRIHTHYHGYYYKQNQKS